MALYESQVVLAALLWKFKFSMKEGFVMDDAFMLTMKAAHGLQMHVSYRPIATTKK